MWHFNQHKLLIVTSLNHYLIIHLVTSGTRGVDVTLERQKNLSESSLVSRTLLGSGVRVINQLQSSVPGGARGRGSIIYACKELLGGLLSGLDALITLGVVVLVKVVNGLLGLLNGLLSLSLGLLVSSLNLQLRSLKWLFWRIAANCKSVFRPFVTYLRCSA